MERGLERLHRVMLRPVLPGARLRAYEALLLAWFAALTTLMIIRPIVTGMSHPLSVDTIVYTRAAEALVAGADPWRVEVFGITFAAPPPSLIPHLLLVGLPDDVLVVIGFVVPLASTIYVLRKLRLPAWWILFPPVAIAIAAGSLAMPMLALLVRGGAVADAAALVVRAHAALPLVALGRWRGLAIGAAVIVVTAPFLGWTTYIADREHVAAVIQRQAGNGISATALPLLIPWVVLMLALIGRRRAAWLLVPALWPSAQLHYAAMALPVLAEMPFVAAGFASYSALLGVVGLTAQVAADRLAGRRQSNMSLPRGARVAVER